MPAARLPRHAAPIVIAALAVGLALVLQLAGVSRAYAFTASFDWCSGSPNFALHDVPEGTVTLQFAMTDLDKPAFHHGGGSVGYRGQSEVPCGAFATGFVGPAPPPGETHTYEFIIRALAPDGTVLATTTARKRFPE